MELNINYFFKNGHFASKRLIRSQRQLRANYAQENVVSEMYFEQGNRLVVFIKKNFKKILLQNRI